MTYDLCRRPDSRKCVTLFGFEGAGRESEKLAPLAQLVEQLTLNQWVLGSSPRRRTKRPVGQVVKTAASHAGNTSSNLVRVTSLRLKKDIKQQRLFYIWKGESPPHKLVLITVRVHPFPSRTRKLSSLLPTILGWRRPGKIGSANTARRVIGSPRLLVKITV